MVVGQISKYLHAEESPPASLGSFRAVVQAWKEETFIWFQASVSSQGFAYLELCLALTWLWLRRLLK